MIKLAVILAAGQGSRMQLSRKPKGFLNIAGKPLIEYSIQALLTSGIERIIIGTGFKAEFYEELTKTYPQIILKRNDEYLQCGSLKTLCGLSSLIAEDFILLESDILYDGYCIQDLIDFSHQNAILMAKSPNIKDAVWVEMGENNTLKKMSKERSYLSNPSDDILVGITKMSSDTFQQLLRFAPEAISLNPNQHYDFVFENLSAQFYILHSDDLIFTEIDDDDDLDFAITHVYPKLILSYDKTV